MEEYDKDGESGLRSPPPLTSISPKYFGARDFEGLKLSLLASMALSTAAAATTAGIASASAVISYKSVCERTAQMAQSLSNNLNAAG